MAHRIFMYATHPTLVDQESQMFHNMGMDVYTAAWATKTRSNWESKNIYFNPKHFYQGESNFLDNNIISTLSKIPTEMCGTVKYDIISSALINNFDILYVSQITPWLMNYAEDFLNAGKIVLFRTFCYPLQAWGEPNNFQDLYKYNKFYILPTHDKEIKGNTFGEYSRVRYIMASVCDELFEKRKKTTDEKFALTVGQMYPSGEATLKAATKAVIDVKIINRIFKFVTFDEYVTLFNDCYLYIDYVTQNVNIHYPIFHYLPRTLSSSH